MSALDELRARYRAMHPIIKLFVWLVAFVMYSAVPLAIGLPIAWAAGIAYKWPMVIAWAIGVYRTWKAWELV